MERFPLLLSMDRKVKRVPLLGPLLKRLRTQMFASASFKSSAHYWESRYQRGHTSGAGSYGRLAQFKADFLNRFVHDHGIESVVELGCGDGAQLKQAIYPLYVGLDVSETSIRNCRRTFRSDQTKRFLHTSEPGARDCKADCAVSLDVIYHLVEDTVFDSYMRTLVALASRYITIYSSDFDGPGPAPHVRHRHFSQWMVNNCPFWKEILVQPNAYPCDPDRPDDTSWANFHIYEACARDRR